MLPQTLYKLPLAPCGPDPGRTALRAFSGVRAKRALFAGSVTHHFTTNLVYVLPVDKDEESGDGTGVWISYLSNGIWLPFSDVVRLLRGPASAQFAGKEIQAETRLFLAQADKWLQETHMHPPSALSVWKTPAPYRTRSVTNNKLREDPVVDVASQAKRSVKNPMYGAHLVVSVNPVQSGFQEDFETRDLQAPDAARRLMPEAVFLHDHEADIDEAAVAPWALRYPLHRAAVDGDVPRLRALVAEGYSAKEPDDEGWTPLHYAAWHGFEGIVRLLLEDWIGAPAETTPFGDTALHFASRNGHVDIVKVLLSCPIVNPSAENAAGRTPLSLCEQFALGDWQEVSDVLRNPEKYLHAVNRFTKIPQGMTAADMVEHRIFLMDGSEKVLRLPEGEVTSTEDLRNAVAGLVHLPADARNLFMIWMVSPSLQMQLEPSTKPLRRLRRWPQMAELYTENTGVAEQPVLVFRRDARLRLADERKARSPIAIKLLFDEALHNFIHSLYGLPRSRLVLCYCARSAGWPVGFPCSPPPPPLPLPFSPLPFLDHSRRCAVGLGIRRRSTTPCTSQASSCKSASATTTPARTGQASCRTASRRLCQTTSCSTS